MLNTKFFLLVYRFIEYSAHERYFWEKLDKLCPKYCDIKPGMAAVHGDFNLQEIYKSCCLALDDSEYLFIFPLTRQYFPLDAKLQHYLDFGEPM